MTDLQLIHKIKNKNCSDSLVELADRHDGLFYKITSKYLSKINLGQEEINAEKLIILLKSCESFDIRKNVKFSSWYGNQIRFHWLNKIRADKRNILNYAERGVFLNIIDESEQSEEIFNIINAIIKKLPKNDRQILKSRYNVKGKRSWREISKEIGISSEKLTKKHKQIINKIKQTYGIQK